MTLRARLLALALGGALAQPAWPLDLLDTWRAASGHDPEYAAARAAYEAGQARRRQADALWRPTVVLEAGAAKATQESRTRGAWFSAPGFGSSSGVGFDTSVTGGDSLRASLALRQPLLNRELGAQSRQLALAADAAVLEWEAAGQGLMLRSAERYFETALAAQQLRLLRQQEQAVEKARIEAQDRFRIGDRPVTDVHEATARAAALRAQRTAAETELAVRRARLADLTGLQVADDLTLPGTTAQPPAGTLAEWLERAAARNPQVRLAEARVRSAEQELRKTDRALSPAVDLVARVGRERLSGDGDFGDASHRNTQGAVGVQLTVPLYTGGMRSARNQESTALLAKARAELDTARQQAAQQMRAAWHELAAGREQAQALEAGLQASLARLDATQVGLQAGDRTTLDLLNARNDAMAAELALLQSRAALMTQRLRVAALAGELDEGLLAAASRELKAEPARTSALAPMVAFDAVYIPALAMTSSASQDAAAAPRAKAAASALHARWPELRQRLSDAFGAPAPAGWQQALVRVDARIAAATRAVAAASWHDAHEELEEVRLELMKARREQGMDYFVDRLTAYHEPMEVLALAGSQLKPQQVDAGKRQELARAAGEARALWDAVERFPFDAAAYGLAGERKSQFDKGMADERAALEALAQALRADDASRLLKAASAIKPPFARVFTAFGQPAGPR